MQSGLRMSGKVKDKGFRHGWIQGIKTKLGYGLSSFSVKKNKTSYDHPREKRAGKNPTDLDCPDVDIKPILKPFTVVSQLGTLIAQGHVCF